MALPPRLLVLSKESRAEFGVLKRASARLKPRHPLPSSKVWKDSPFAWIRQRHIKARGQIGEELIAEWCASREVDCQPAAGSHVDRSIGASKVEIKLATLSKAGDYTFNQLRRQRYAYVILLGLSPATAHCWVIKKSDLWVRGRVGLRKQHGGQAARDTWMLKIRPGREPKWLLTTASQSLHDESTGGASVSSPDAFGARLESAHPASATTEPPRCRCRRRVRLRDRRSATWQRRGQRSIRSLRRCDGPVDRAAARARGHGSPCGGNQR